MVLVTVIGGVFTWHPLPLQEAAIFVPAGTPEAVIDVTWEYLPRGLKFHPSSAKASEPWTVIVAVAGFDFPPESVAR